MSSLAFDGMAAQDKETVALQELNKFLEQPHSIGLDNLKESLRNVVQLMLELKGYSTGYALQHLVMGEHSSMALSGILRDDAKKKREIEDFWREFLELERLMSAHLYEIKQNTVTHIAAIEENIDKQIAAIDTAIIAKAGSESEAEIMKKSNNKRKKLLKFKKHVRAQKEEVLEADDAKEVIEIHKNIIEDVQDFKENKFSSTTYRPNPLGPLGNILEESPINDTLKRANAKNDPYYNNNDTSKASETGSSGSGDSGKQSSVASLPDIAI